MEGANLDCDWDNRPTFHLNLAASNAKCDWDNRPTLYAIGTIARRNTIVPIVGSTFEQGEMAGMSFDCDWGQSPYVIRDWGQSHDVIRSSQSWEVRLNRAKWKGRFLIAIGTIALRKLRLGQSHDVIRSSRSWEVRLSRPKWKVRILIAIGTIALPNTRLGQSPYAIRDWDNRPTRVNACWRVCRASDLVWD